MNVFAGSRKGIGKPIAGEEVQESVPISPTDFFVRIWSDGIGGVCPIPAEQLDPSRVTKQYKLSPFAVRINKMKIKTNWQAYATAVFEELVEGCGVNWYIDFDTEVDMYVGVSVDGNITDAKIIDQTTKMGGPWQSDDYNWDNAYEVDLSKFITQPKDPAYTGVVHVTVMWLSTNYWVQAGEFGYQMRFPVVDIEEKLT